MIQNNPTLATGIVAIIAFVAILFGSPLTPEQDAALVVVVAAILTIISSKLTVPKVPTADASPKSIQEPPVP